jgi:hypothetical protein
MAHDRSFLQIPTGVVSRIDVGRLVREVEALDDFIEQASVRKPGTSIQMPRTSKMLDEMLQINKINALVDEDRTRLLNFLITVRAKAPVLHMSFSADPSPLFTQKLITWLREYIHPLVLLQVGLQPNIGAGCVVRTTNKFFDLSLRKHFGTKHDLLLAKIRNQESVAPKEGVVT